MATLFVCCGKKDKDGTSASTVDLSEILESIPEELKGTTIKYYTWYPFDKTPEYAVTKTFEEKTGITIEFERGPYSDFNTALNVKISTGESPDLIPLLNPNIYSVKNLTPIDQIDFDFTDGAWDQQTMKDYTFGGKAYAVNLKNTSAYDPICVVYNTETFEENDLEDPYELSQEGKWTWSKFEEICEAYADIDEGNYGASLCPLNVYGMSHNVAYIKFEDGRYASNLDNPLLSSTWRTTIEWIQKGYVHAEVWQTPDFITGKCGLFFSSIRHTRNFPESNNEDYFRRLKVKNVLGVAPMPVHDDKDAVNYQPLMEYMAYGIPQGAKNAAAVPYYLRYLLDEGNYPEVWPTKETEAIYKEMRANPNRASMPAAVITKDSGMDGSDVTFRIKKSDPQQIATTLMTWSGTIGDAVSKANSAIDALGK